MLSSKPYLRALSGSFARHNSTPVSRDPRDHKNCYAAPPLQLLQQLYELLLYVLCSSGFPIGPLGGVIGAFEADFVTGTSALHDRY
jgi:hypothetical protein